MPPTSPSRRRRPPAQASATAAPGLLCTVSGHVLPLPLPEGVARPPAWVKWFERDWAQGLFLLAARRPDPKGSPSVRYWRGVGEAWLMRLCRDRPEDPLSDLVWPTDADIEPWMLDPPDIPGGEHIELDLLLDVFMGLDRWFIGDHRRTETFEAFIARRAPAWRDVGRICFHLAENPGDADRPFAFLATMICGISEGPAAGGPRHRLLRDVLVQLADEPGARRSVPLFERFEAVADAAPWVGDLLDTARLFGSLAWTADEAHRLLRTVDELESAGVSVRTPDWWTQRRRPQVAVTIGETDVPSAGLQSVLDFDVRLALGGEQLTREEIDALLDPDEAQEHDHLVRVRGGWAEVDREQLRRTLAHWEKIATRAERGEIGFVEGMRLLAGVPIDLRGEPGAADGDASAPEHDRAEIIAGTALRELLEEIRRPDRQVAARPPGLETTLRPYQQHGVAWLDLLTALGLGACLADDMGLGKTVQVLALLLHRRAAAEVAGIDLATRTPALLVVPASLLGNWRHEAQRFAPTLTLRFLHASESHAAELDAIAADPAERLAGTDLAVTTYSMLARQPWLAELRWPLVVLDEAQAIKNAGTRQSRAARSLPADARIALTGTPIENRIGDLWSLFDFANPGLLGAAATFKAFVRGLPSREEDRHAPLRRLTSPYILRRMKTDRSIIADLPDKVVVRQACALTKRQARDYQMVVDRLGATLAESDGMARRGAVLTALMRLKQVCNHPTHLRGHGDYDPAASGKFLRLREIAEELAASGDRMLVFTQFREIIEPLSAFLAGIFKRDGLVLHGGTAVGRRAKLVEQFQADDGPPFMVLSLKAGGTGLTLTAASHVVHFDRWWNPAVEDQATDRAYRIGQHRNVLVHTFVVEGTIEERIDEMIQDKRGLAAGVLGGAAAEVDLTELSDEQLLELVRLDIGRVS